MHVPCRKCAHCRRQRAIEWKTRLLHELAYWENAVFLTLTYHPECMPEDLSVDKTELQRWLKRLRRRIEPRKVRYYAVGEYGEKFGRPHYHAIVFGLQACGSCWSCCQKGIGPDRPSADCEVIRDTWNLGFVDVEDVTAASIGYVCGYIEKALYLPEWKNLARPFSLMSLGLGRDYVEEHRDQLVAMRGVTVQGKEVGLPKYYREKLPEITPEMLLEKGQERREELHDHYFEKYECNPDVNLAVKRHRKQSQRNLKAELGLKKRDYEE